ncbi:DUF3857 domain-containing protein [bacterium]|nr:DUF3857 domain-containing protein [bacterium]
MRKHLFSFGLVLALGQWAWGENEGWKDLWANRLDAAQSKFSGSLTAHPGDAEAFRGLGWMALMKSDDEALLKSWGEMVLTHPELPASLAVWPDVSAAARRLGRDSWQRNLISTIMSRPDCLPALRNNAEATLDRLNLLHPEVPSAVAGRVSHWQAIGPFDNVSGSGLDKSFPIERGEAGPKLVGKSGQELHWRDLPSLDRTGLVELHRLSQEEAEVFYGATAIEAKQAGPANLLFEAMGAGKVWLNGQLVLQHSQYADNSDFDFPYMQSVTLRQGWNTLVVKLASQENVCMFSLALQDPQGAPAALQVDPGKIQVGQALSGNATDVLPRTQQLIGQQDWPDAPLFLARCLEGDGRGHEAVEALQKFLQAHPDSALVQWQLSQKLDSEGQSDAARDMRGKALQTVPQISHAALLVAAEQSDQLPPLQKLAQQRPRDFLTQFTLYRSLSAHEMEAEARRTLNDLARLELGPDQVQSTYLALQREGLHAPAQSLLRQGLQRFPQESSLLRLKIAELSRAGQSQEALQLAEALAPQVGDGNFWVVLAELQKQANLPEKALASLRKAFEARPQDGTFCAKLADQLQQQGETAEAARCYREAISLDPGQVALREQLRRVSGEKPVLDWLVPAEPFDASKAKTKLKQPVVVLLDEGRYVVYPDHASLSVFRLVCQVNDEAGVKKMARQPAPGGGPFASTSLEHARLIKPDGRVLDMSDESSDEEALFPSLQPGDRTDVQWRSESARRGGLAQHYWTSWHFDTSAPVELNRLVVACPENMPLRIQAAPKVPPPSETAQAEWKVREWRLQHIAPKISYKFAGPSRDRGLRLNLSTIPNWGAVVDWYQDLSAPLCKSDPVVSRKAHELTDHLTGEQEKIAAIQLFVSESLRYQTTPFRNSAFVPTPGRKVLLDAYGDCKDKAALICSMLNSLGIEANMVLLSTRSNGLQIPLPSPFFNHAIVRINRSTGPLWVDGTAVQPDLAVLPVDDQEAPALVIDGATTGLTLTPKAPLLSSRSRHSNAAKLDANGGLKGDYRLRAEGSWASALRDALTQVGEERLQVTCSEMMSGILRRQTDTLRVELKGMKDPRQPVEMLMSFRANRFARRVDSSLLLENLFGAEDSYLALKNALKSPRDQPLDLTEIRGEQLYEVALELPPGYRLVRPVLRRKEIPAATYLLSIGQEKQLLRGSLLIQFKSTQLPLQQSQSLRSFLEELEDAVGVTVAVRKN